MSNDWFKFIYSSIPVIYLDRAMSDMSMFIRIPDLPGIFLVAPRPSQYRNYPMRIYLLQRRNVWEGSHIPTQCRGISQQFITLNYSPRGANFSFNLTPIAFRAYYFTKFFILAIILRKVKT